MILKSKSIISIFLKLKIVLHSKAMIVICIIIPFILTVLGSPSVSSRYFFPLVYPMVVLILFYEKKLRNEFVIHLARKKEIICFIDFIT